MGIIKYELIICEINNQNFNFRGIKVDTKQDIKRITHSADYDAIGYITGDRTIDFTFTDPKDEEIINKLFEEWIETHEPFFMLISAKNVDTEEWDPIATLEDCVLTKVDHTLNSKEEWKPSVSGMARKFKRINHQFDTNTPKPTTNTNTEPEEDNKGIISQLGEIIGGE